jgi:hypothetical protein
MFCKNFKSEFQKAKRLLEDKIVRFAAEAVTTIGKKMLLFLEDENLEHAIAKFVDIMPGESDGLLVEAIKTAIRNAIMASAHMQQCTAINDDDERLQCYLEALKKLNREQWRDEVGLFAARTLKEYIQLARGLKEKIGVIKIIVEGIILSTKK